MQKKSIIIGVAVVIAIAIAIVLGVTLSKGDSAKQNSGEASKPSATTAAPIANVSDSDLIPTNTAPNGSVSKTEAPNLPKSDPETDPTVFSMLAIGDWGATVKTGPDQPGTCCKLYKGTNRVNTDFPRYKIDYYAQNHVAKLLGMSAAEIKPVRVLGHGDNIYWDGAGPKDIAYRMSETFEKVYNAPALAGVKWLNVAGNHDIGGSEYICGDADGEFRECKDTAEMLKYLDIKFDVQADYKSPNQDRWAMKHYFKDTYTKDGVSVEVYSIDTNHAEIHGAPQVCCQCYGYARKYSKSDGDSVCANAKAGDQLCANGDMGMYKSCIDKIEQWATDSYTSAEKDMAASTATYKIINTHYSPHFHMSPEKMKKWYKLCKDNNVTAWFNGHTHGSNHETSVWGTNFFQNGAGGGIISESSSIPDATNVFVKSQWAAKGTPYGFMELSFSKDWLKVQFVSFDKKWQFGGMDAAGTVAGGLMRGHCWYIPRTLGTGGVPCKSSNDGVMGAPT